MPSKLPTSDRKKKRIRELYDQGFSLREIADKVGVKDASTVLYHLKHVKITPRLADLEQRFQHMEVVLFSELARRVRFLEERLPDYVLETCDHEPKAFGSQLCRRCYNRLAKQHERKKPLAKDEG